MQRKSTNKSELKANSKAKRPNLLGKVPAVEQIIKHPSGIKTGNFTDTEVETALKNTENRKEAGEGNILPQVSTIYVTPYVMEKS